MDDSLYKDLLMELECPVCTNYMAPPIRQCTTGHSICEPCRDKLKKCPLCQAEFTDAKNLALEALAGRIQYPCINAGCPAKMPLKSRDYHERNCGFRSYKCALPTCSWSGQLNELATHWEDKKLHKPYKTTNLCHIKIMNDTNFINMVQANNEIYWYKCKIFNGIAYFAVQFIGQPDKAESFFYEVEVFKPGHTKRRLLLGDYCQSIHVSDEDLFKPGACCFINIESLNHFVGIDKMMIYNLRVHVMGSKNQNVQQPQKQDKAQHQPELQDQAQASHTNPFLNNPIQSTFNFAQPRFQHRPNFHHHPNNPMHFNPQGVQKKYNRGLNKNKSKN